MVQTFADAKSKDERHKIVNDILSKKDNGRYQVDMSKSSEVSESPELLTFLLNIFWGVLEVLNFWEVDASKPHFFESNKRDNEDFTRYKQKGRARVIVESEMRGGSFASLMFSF